MKYEEIIKLLDAGYTKEEILSMNEPDPKEPEPDPKEPEPDPKEPEQDSSAMFEEMKNFLSDMRKELTALNIMTSRQPAERTPEDIIANIINPTRDKNEGR